MKNFTPREIVSELDKYIIGQAEAKRAVAIALRNRWRRYKVDPELRDEIAPKNIIMIGPTGVGKTEIARRLAKLAEAPFIKVEATKYTEVGYVGKDVESMIRDLTDISVNMVKEEEKSKVVFKAGEQAEERILDLLLPPLSHSQQKEMVQNFETEEDRAFSTREKFRKMLREGALNDRLVELEVQDKRAMPVFEVFSAGGMDSIDNIKEMFSNMMPRRKKRRKVKVQEALKILQQREENRLIDMDKVIEKALYRVENSGIVFLDEIDKIATQGNSHGPDVSRQGVQRDILPIVEGSNVNTKYGVVKTDHVLFIAAGAFHVAKPSDLIPELQGRFPIRVELQSLTREDFIKILTEPANSLTRQYKALLETEEIVLKFTQDGIESISEVATRVNEGTENIGARRLHTIMEKLLDEISFNAPDLQKTEIIIDKAYVTQHLEKIAKDHDLSRYIL